LGVAAAVVPDAAVVFCHDGSGLIGCSAVAGNYSFHFLSAPEENSLLVDADIIIQNERKVYISKKWRNLLKNLAGMTLK
jgi:hypothetical protein